MRFVREEIQKGERIVDRWVFALGKQEAHIICGCLINAYRWIPAVLDTERDRARIKQMINTIKNTIPEMPDDKERDFKI